MQRFYLLLLCLCIAFSVQAQRKMRYKSVHVATSFNYFPAFESYSRFDQTSWTATELDLTFLTPNSGTFILEDGERIYIDVTTDHRSPIQRMGVGASVQIVNEERRYHEISLSRLTFNTSQHKLTYVYTGGRLQDPLVDYDGTERRLFTGGLRYEMGKYFKARDKRAPMRFALGAALESTYFYESYQPLSARYFPWRVSVLQLELAIVPTLALRLSDKVSLDFKVIPNLLLADFGSVRTENPILTQAQQQAQRSYNPPDFNVLGSILLRYEVKEAEKRRTYRRRSEG